MNVEQNGMPSRDAARLDAAFRTLAAARARQQGGRDRETGPRPTAMLTVSMKLRPCSPSRGRLTAAARKSGPVLASVHA